MRDKPESRIDRLLSRKQVMEIVGLSYPTIWDMMRKGQFPRSVQVGRGPVPRVAWRESEIMAWMYALPRSRLLGDPEPEKPKRRRLKTPD